MSDTELTKSYAAPEVHPTWCKRCESLTCHEDAGRCGLCPRCQNDDMEAFAIAQAAAEQAERDRQTERANRSTVAIAALCAAMADPLDDALRLFPNDRGRALHHAYGRNLKKN